MSTAPYPFPTTSRHDPPAVQPMRPVDHVPDETAIDHGVEESFPASDPVSVNITRAEPTTPPCAPEDEAGTSSSGSQWGPVLRTGLVAGACASLASTAVLAWRGHIDVGSLVAPTNAVSHVRWKRRALRARTLSVRHTLLGYAIHHASATMWAMLHAVLRARLTRAKGWKEEIAGAAATAATACAVDYTITPHRLRPGFEHHLSRKSMTFVYAALAIGLAVGCVLADSDKRQ